ncbi:universal stress protein [Rhodovulum strictum]|uniref:UspA domain-containing protein n=1 Tax=Rhodovulum strictum TaxID=58314 RepID=A0A844BDD1_9RHOB|nr:universal stress protein [Rhodovulum strictum]MRH20629.1 hypothetical protein [Rhodovulum strictum]
MYATALIALDFTAAEGPLPDWLGDLRAMGVRRAILVHVVRPGYGQGAGYGHEEALRDWLSRRAEGLRAAGLEVAVDIRTAGDVAGDLVAAAAQHGAELIVIGSRGQSLLRGLFLGSTARALLRQSPLPVLLEWLEPEGEGARGAGQGPQRIVLGTDFSYESQAAEAAAVALAATGASVEVVHVQIPDGRAIYARWPEMARVALAHIADDIRAAGGRAAIHQPDGKPAEEIARLAAAQDSDLIIVGKHGQNRLQSMVIGSTAAHLCEIARRPVLMVPSPQREG